MGNHTSFIFFETEVLTGMYALLGRLIERAGSFMNKQSCPNSMQDLVLVIQGSGVWPAILRYLSNCSSVMSFFDLDL